MQGYVPDWSEWAKMVFAAITAVIALYNWQAGRRRSKLKDDLDILRRYREEVAADPGELAEDARYCCLREKIEQRMRKEYVLRGTDRSELVTAIGFAALAGMLAFFPSHLPFGIVLPASWRTPLIAGAIGAAVLYAWQARKDRHVERKARLQRPGAPAA